LVAASRTLGVAAELTPGEVNLQLPSPASTVPCFQAPAGGEVVVGGRKLIGSAMRSHSGAILQHGAILLDWDSELQAGSMGLADDRLLRASVTTLAEELDAVPGRETLEEVFVAAFSEGLGVRFEEGGLSTAEAARENELAASFVINP
jgi:lipoate-protein ligase A